jgi:molecular chaperone HtpG
MKEMAAIQPGMSFYGEMPDMLNVLLNEEHPIVKRILGEAEAACSQQLNPINEELAALEAHRNELNEASKDKKIDEIPQSEKDDLEDTEKKIAEAQSNKEAVLAGYAAGNPQIQQLIDITLLQNNMLTGEALSNFVKRSIELMK